MNFEKKLICFDYDGVIADSRQMILEVFDRQMTKLGLSSRLSPEELSVLPEMGFRQISLGAGVPETELAEFLSRLPAELMAASESVGLFDEVAGLVLKLSRRHTLAIVSASPVGAIEPVLERNDLRACFSYVLGWHDPGTKAEKIFRLAADDYSKSSSWMIGDSASDIRAGRMSGVNTAAVLWGWQSEETLRAQSPTRVMRAPSELLELL